MRYIGRLADFTLRSRHGASDIAARGGGVSRALKLSGAAASGSLASGNKAEHVECQLSVDGPKLHQRPVTADIAVDAGAAGQRQGLGGWTWRGGELGGDVAAGQPDHRAAVVREVSRKVDDHAVAHIVADMLAVGEELVMEDDLVAQRKGRTRITDVVRLNQLERAEHHPKDERLRLDRARFGRL